MLMPDVNILIYAHRSDEKVHKVYRAWFDELVGGAEPFALSVLVAVAFVRIVSHERFAGSPTPLPQALATIDAIAADPNCHMLAPGERHWELVSSLCRGARATGRAVGDAQHAAVAIEHGCTWVTRDSDFQAFVDQGLRWEHLVLTSRTTKT